MHTSRAPRPHAHRRCGTYITSTSLSRPLLPVTLLTLQSPRDAPPRDAKTWRGQEEEEACLPDDEPPRVSTEEVATESSAGDMREGAAATAARGKGAQVVPPLVLSEMEELVSEGADLLERLPSRDAADVARLVAGDVSGSRSPVALALQAHLVSRPLCGLLAVIGSRRLGVVVGEVLGWDRAGF